MRRFAAIPAHPQKQYTRRWRLYHFCGFYYPIREVIPIAIYHWNIGIVSRGKGKSAVAAAAYRSGEKLTNEWDGMTHDYTRKGGVVHTEIMLPPHAPPSFSDRSTLWNSVELYEKAGNAQLAREIDAALPIELSREEQIRLVREYCSSQFVSRGMCVDYAIHDTDSGNPHCHIMLTMRPLDERGTWTAKSKKEYDLDENGERIRLPSGRYKTHKIDLTGWNDKDNTLLWRKAWADYRGDARNLLHHEIEIMRGVGHRKLVVIVDEGHLLSKEMLEEIRFLLNYKMDSENPLALILAGQTELWEKLRLQAYRAILHRVDIQCFLMPYEYAQTKAYIEKQLTYAGHPNAIFSEDAMKAVHSFSSGIPRLINRACTQSLVYAYQNRRAIIDDRMVQLVLEGEVS